MAQAGVPLFSRIIAPLAVWPFSRWRSVRLFEKLARFWSKGRDTRVPLGTAAGLWINPGMSNTEYALGTNEPPVQEALAGLLKPGMIYCDIGANIGFFTLVGARLVGGAGRVYAFEPLPANLSILHRNLRLNEFNNVTVFEGAVSRTAGQGELLVAGYSGGSSLATAGPPPDLVGRLSVRLFSLDILVAEGQIQPPNVIKIDVEGAEMEVFEGMQDTLETHRPVLVYEIDDEDQGTFERKSADCVSFLASRDYHIHTLEESYPGIGWHVANYVATPK